MIPLESVHYDTFVPLIGKAFVMLGTSPSVELTLTAVTKLGHKRSDAPRDPFSLTFHGPQGLRLPQGIREFRCEPLGEIGLFITQLADGPQGSEFEAIFT